MIHYLETPQSKYLFVAVNKASYNITINCNKFNDGIIADDLLPKDIIY